MKTKTVGILILALLLAALVLPLSVGASGGGQGSFVLAAVSANEVIIEPTRIEYRSGDTVQDALLRSGFAFEGLEQGEIFSIEDVVDNFCRYFDYTDEQGRNYILETPAEKVGFVFFTVSLNDVPEVFPLLQRMEEYRSMTDGVQLYGDAKTAYRNAANGLRSLNAKTAGELLARLDAAINAYEKRFEGSRYTVRFALTQGGKKPAKATVTVVDEYEQKTESSGTELSLLAGTYRYTVSDGGINRVEGTLSVGEDAPAPVVTAELPDGNWFGEIRLSRSTGDQFEGARFADENAADEHSTVFLVEDALNTNPVIWVGMGEVPDRENTTLRTVYTDLNGKDQSATKRSWESRTTALVACLDRSMTDRELTLEACCSVDGAVQIQSHRIVLRRFPTVKSIKLLLPDGSEHFCLPGFSAVNGNYSITVVTDTLRLEAESFGTEGYSVEGTGSFDCAGDTERTLTVRYADGREFSYHFAVSHAAAAYVRIDTPAGCSLAVFDSEEHSVTPGADGRYALLPGERYHYVASRTDRFHASASFVAEDGMHLTAAAPESTGVLESLAFYDKSSYKTRKAYLDPDTFIPGGETVRITLPDAASILYVQATAAQGYSVTAVFGTESGEKTVVIGNKVSDTGGANALTSCVAVGGSSAPLAIRCSRSENGVNYYEETRLLLCRSTHLKSLALSTPTQDVSLLDEKGNSVKFNRETLNYSIELSNDETVLELVYEFLTDEGYTLRINGAEQSARSVSLPLNPEQETESLTLQVSHRDENAIENSYSIRIIKKAPVPVRFVTEPAEAVVYIVNNQTELRVFPDENGVAPLIPGSSYSYTVTAPGYRAVQDTLYSPPEGGETLKLELLEAKGSEHREVSAEWPSFRADTSNNGVVGFATPIKAEDAALYWATKLGDGYGSDATGCPIIADGYLYTYAGNCIYKVDTVSGEVVAKGTMERSSSFAINNPTYAEGMIFVGLSDGGIQAFDATTLESLWLYTDPLGGQPNCPIVVHNGFLYTGFWSGEELKADLVCLSLTDEDAEKSNEAKLATWRYTCKGGFYWAGCYVCDNYLLVGTDDGQAGYTKGYASFLSMDPRTGRIIDSITLKQPGDIRSAVTMADGTAYFTTKGGYFYCVDVDGNGRLGTLRYIKLQNGSDTAPAMSTCTPAIWNGRAYIGVCGSSQFGEYSGHNITVIDLQNWCIAYSVPTQGYPQTSGLVTTAYGGSVYVYFFDNYTPGKLRCLEDRSGQTAPSEVTTEEYMQSGSVISVDSAYCLFTPVGTQAQYAICSPICDKYGTIYFKNDSAQLMALGSGIEKLELDRQPDKLSYDEGECFDPTGMKVLATYKNGAVRDVTDYVSWSEKPLRADDTEFELRFEHVMYHDAEGESGVVIPSPYVYVTLQIAARDMSGDTNDDGEIDNVDAALVYADGNGVRPLTDDERGRSDINGDKTVDAVDAAEIYEVFNDPAHTVKKGGK